ncbi:response regulator transcription factor [Kutzneria viridogrisea]|uniref:HTH luxR-type domain-containing protein n=2 Tax=Kutzneria TaxID=43356 RepID=W5WD55_9PSEU|nr:response regulator transcription factor [Kutzneria albida]AHH98797.1 hypothetical protein KALB_5435 [Kutzneria albida DSM 43870]MBA8923685.1 DNA-binding NarL/FixJ family response regulator [Kutzneria viridogrisea]
MKTHVRFTGILRVLAIDATPLVRVGLRIVIEQAAGLEWLGATDNPNELRRGLSTLLPHIVIVDGAVDPYGHLVRDLVGENPRLTVVALLHDHQRTDVWLRTVRDAGAHGVVRRDAAPSSLVTAVVSAYTTRRFIDPGLRVAGHRGPDNADTLLTPRQHEILRMIASGIREATIAEKLFVSPATVRTHIKQLRGRLGARDRAHAIARAFSLGLLPLPTNVTGSVDLPALAD